MDVALWHHSSLTLLLQALLLVISSCILLLFFAYRAFVIRYPSNLPRIGADKDIPWSEMRKRYVTDCLSVFGEAYENYSKKGNAVLIPVFGPHDEVILPPSSLTWLVRQPDDVISSMEAQIDSIQLQHSLGHKFAYDPWGGMLIKSDLNTALETVCAVMNEEIGRAFSATWKDDTHDWAEVDLFLACRSIVGRATLRFTLGDSPVGHKLVADDSFVQCCYGVLDGMLHTAGKMAATRKPFRPFLGCWESRTMPAKLKDLRTRLEPLYNERMAIIQRNHVEKEPQDFLQMMLRHAQKERPNEFRNPDDLTRRIAVSNFGTMHQTVLTMYNIILNILGSDPEFKTISVLRDEVTRVFGDGNDTTSKVWTKSKVSAMVRADSIARETFRVNTFIGRTVQRLVIAPNGVVTEDGIRLPRGTMVSILAHQAQTDPELFSQPDKFDPFRFSRLREAARDAETGKAGLHHLSMVSTGSDYLPFSHGKHACPGRFLVDFESKMIMAYAVMNYDIELPESYGGKRPPHNWFAGFGVPPLDVKIRVKRKTGSS